MTGIQDILDYLDQGVCAVDEKLRLRFANRKFCELLDLPETLAVPGTPAEAIFRFNAERGEYGPGDVETLVREQIALAETFEPHRFERIRPDGTVLEIVGNPLPGGGFIRTFTDISERDQIERALRESKTRLIEAQRVGRMGSWEHNFKTGTLHWSDEVYEIFGVQRTEAGITSDEFIALVHPEDRGAVSKAFSATRQGKTTYGINHRIVRPDGEVRFVHEDAKVELASDGAPSRVYGMVRDITEEKLAEQALEQSERRYRDLVEGSLQGILIHRDFKPLYVNQAYCEIHGYGSPDEMLALDSVEVLIGSDDLARLRKIADTRRRGGDAPSRYEYQARKKDGSPVWLSNVVRTVEWQGRPAFQSTVIDVSPRITSEHALRESEARFRDIATAASDWFWEIDAERRYVFISQAVVANVGREPEWYVGRSHDDVVAQFFDPADWQPFDEAFAARRPYRNLVVQRTDENGQCIWVSSSGVPVFGDDGEFQGFRGCTTNVTEAVLAEQALRQRRQRLVEAQRLAQMASFELDLTSHVLSWSDEIYRILEIGPEGIDVSCEAFMNAVHPDDREAVGEACSDALSHHVPYDISYRLLMSDGRIKWVDERCETEFADDGEPVILRGTVQDVTAQRVAEKALNESRATLSGILEISEEAIIMADSDLNIFLFSRGAQRVFGYDADEAARLTIDQLIPERHRAAHQRHVKAFTDGAETSRRMTGRSEITALRKDGEEFPAAISLSKFATDGGYHYSMIVRDVGPEKAIHDKLLSAKLAAESANRAKSSFLANMSHELRTPLNAIIGFSEMICEQTFGPVGSPRYLEYLRAINESGAHLLQIINDILDLSKVEAGEVELDEQPFDVSDAIAGCMALLQERAQSTGVELKLTAEPALPALIADERMVKQIFINLLSNAIKFTPADGEIETRVWYSHAAGYVIQVADTGIGIASEDIPLCLAPFKQVDGDLNRKFEGTGLGLPLAKSLVEMHGGSIDLQSKLGTGTTVTVRFPAERILAGAATAS